MSTYTICATIVLIVAAAIFGKPFIVFFAQLGTTKDWHLAWQEFRKEFVGSAKAFWSLCIAVGAFFRGFFPKRNTAPAQKKQKRSESRWVTAGKGITALLVSVAVAFIALYFLNWGTSMLGLSLWEANPAGTAPQITDSSTIPAKTGWFSKPVEGLLIVCIAVIGLGGLGALAWYSRKSYEKWGKKVPWEFFLLLLAVNLLIGRIMVPSIWLPFWGHQGYFWGFNIGVLIVAGFHKTDHKNLSQLFALLLIGTACYATYNSTSFQSWMAQKLEESRKEKRLEQLEKPWQVGTRTVTARPGDPKNLLDWETKNPYPVVVGEGRFGTYYPKNEEDCFYVRFNGEGEPWLRCSSSEPIDFKFRVRSIEFMSATDKDVDIIVKIK